MNYEPVYNFDDEPDNFKLGKALKGAWNSTAGKVVRKIGGAVLDIIPITSIAKGAVEMGIDVGKGIHNANKSKKAKKAAEEARKKQALGVGIPSSIGTTQPNRIYEPTIDFDRLNDGLYWTLEAID